MKARWLLLIALGLGAMAAWAQEDTRSSLEVTTDEDGDTAVVLDTESIRMTMLPGYQGCVSGFIFKPTGNDILSRMTVKFILAGQGLLQDNFWEQDWRYSEFRHKWYDYKIVSQGPDELAIKFWTTSMGAIYASDSGIISDLLSNIKIERTVRMPVGKPYFLCDVNLSIDMEKDKKGHAKMPQFWMHNMGLFVDDGTEECQRPHILGIAEQTKFGQTVCGDYIYSKDIAGAWTARTAPRTKEGIVYLMDPAYLQSLYNCGNSTVEWFGDNMLVTRERPLRTRVYILPVIGLAKVHFADPHMILQLTPKVITEGPDAGAFEVDYAVCPSYRKVKTITFETTATYGLHERRHEKVRMLDPQPVVRNLRVESPRHAKGLIKRPDGVAIDEKTPLLLDIVAHVEVMEADNKLKTRNIKFQYFHLGAYPTKKNEHLQGGEPLASMDRVEIRPWIPAPDPEMQINNKDFNVFLLMGPHGRHYRLYGALDKVATAGGAKAAWDPKDDIGYSIGFPANKDGLTSFPYDFGRLFNHRGMVNCNSQTDITRLVGQSILSAFFQRGGGYVTFGGESAYAVGAPEGHPLNAFDPAVYASPAITVPEDGKAGQLRVTAPEHPIFKGNGKQAKAIDLGRLPQALSWHRNGLKKETMKPFLRDPREWNALIFGSLPAPLQTAVKALPKARMQNREERARSVYSNMVAEVRTRLDAVCKEVFKDVAAGTLKDGVYAESQVLRVKDSQRIDIRTAFADYGDEDRAAVNDWIDANFTRANPVYFNLLPAELQKPLEELVQKALAGPGTFIQQGDLLMVPEDVQPELFRLLMVKADELPLTARTKVLMEVEAPDGRHPFLVEVTAMKPDPANPQKLVPDPDVGRSLAFLNSPFGDRTQYPAGTVPYWEWDQWEQLVANAIMYAGKEM